jgi:hypothetical protein
MIIPVRNKDPYQLHRAALEPLLQKGSFDESAALVAAQGEAKLLEFLHQQGLAPMWDKTVREFQPGEFSTHFQDSLHQARLEATGEYLIQHRRMQEIRAVLDPISIPHVIYKGAAFRDTYYSEPALRLAVDIDVLVSDENRVRCIQAFRDAGFTFYGEAENISHEVNLLKGTTSIDLHWDIMRPGRTRISVVDWLLEEREDARGFWALSVEGTLLVLLAHPVFTKYSTTPHAALVRMIDLLSLLDNSSPNWEKLRDRLERSGMLTAAWVTLRWLELLTDRPIPEEISGSITPGKLKASYLNYWLENNLPTRYLDRPAIVKAGFTLPAHDSIGDSVRAITSARKLARAAESELKNLEELVR